MLSSGTRKDYPAPGSQGVELPQQTLEASTYGEAQGLPVGSEGPDEGMFQSQEFCLFWYSPVLYSVQRMLFINSCGWKPPKKDIF